MRPYLRAYAVVGRLNEVLGVAGWSNTFHALGSRAVVCELTIAGTTKSAVASDLLSEPDVSKLGEEAFARAAELFDICPPVDPDLDYWVEYDPDTKAVLYEPEFQSSAVDGDKQSEVSFGKPEGQQVIDRLVERLKREGLGLETAKVMVAHGGYGHDPASTRKLYTKLRALLLEKGVEVS
ncbi:MAG: hypothetical protein JSV66_12360 [Trueperaceae bacterium]|nr:MAG: hypothetical protein JSV66_12360 [Trueperaceae bacterium]